MLVSDHTKKDRAESSGVRPRDLHQTIFNLPLNGPDRSYDLAVNLVDDLSETSVYGR